MALDIRNASDISFHKYFSGERCGLSETVKKSKQQIVGICCCRRFSVSVGRCCYSFSASYARSIGDGYRLLHQAVVLRLLTHSVCSELSITCGKR